MLLPHHLSLRSKPHVTITITHSSSLLYVHSPLEGVAQLNFSFEALILTNYK